MVEAVARGERRRSHWSRERYLDAGADGEAGIAALSELARKYGGLPETPKQKSGSGGRHHIFRWPGDGNITNRKNHRGIAIDVRGAGGYFVAAPSQNGTGPYAWELHPSKCEPAEASRWMLAWCRADGKPKKTAFTMQASNSSIEDRAVKYLAKMPPAISGQGGHDQTMEAARVVAWGFDLGETVAYQILDAHYNPRCQPPWSEKELRHKCHDADTVPFDKPRGWLLANDKKYESNGHGGAEPHQSSSPEPEPWDDPLPLDEAPLPPIFPAQVFPLWWGDWVVATAHATQTPPDLAGMLSLATAGAGLATKFAVEIRDDWTEPLNLFSVAALLVGERKSEVFRRVREPVAAYEAAMKVQAAPIIAAEQAEHDLLEARLKGLTARAAKEDDPIERDQLRQQMRQAARELAAHHVPVEPQFICDDATVECLGQLLIQQGGRMLQAGPEGTAFEIAKGRYSDTANFDVYLRGHAGDPLNTDRTGRGHGEIDAVHLSMAIAVQPDVICGLAEEATLAKRGFLARFLYAMPQSKVGRRQIAAASVPEGIREAYRARMTALWEIKGATAHDGRPQINVLRFSPEADQALRQFEQWLEPRLAPEGELSRLCGWANKLAGAIARIAGVLHVAADPRNWEPTIDARTVESAIRLGRDYLLPHARIAFHHMGADERVGDAGRVLDWLGNSVNSVNSVNGVRTFSRRDVHANILGSRYSTEQVQSVLNLLVERGYLRQHQVERASKHGRRVKVEYEAHPCVFKREPRSQSSQGSQSREPGQEG
jgi:hypothetical protein